ncbi:aspartate aminotransferase family protein [[Eubacterium] cellulosolvens]
MAELSRVLDEERARFEAATKRSGELFNVSKTLTPFGVHSNYRYVDPYPIYFRGGKGSRISDVDGNEYIDFNMGFGALVAGHAHPALVEALKKRISEGSLLGFEYEGSAELAKILCDRFGLGMVRFSSTGAEATMHAVRFARAWTKRKKILKFEGCYHGSHDQLLVSVKPSVEKAGDAAFPNAVPASQGVLPEITENTIVAPFNNLEAVEELMRRHGGEVAAIILEPIPMNMGFVPPSPRFLEGLRETCDQYGALLVFDEIKTCGKFYGGASKHYGVAPDLLILGKAIAGGLPLSAIGGKREILERIAPGVLAHAGTFNSNPLCVEAALVSLSKILTEEAMNRASGLGERLAQGYRDVIQDTKLVARVQAIGLSGTILFTDREVTDWRSFLRCSVGKWFSYYVSMLNRRVIPSGTGSDEQWTVSVQHTKEDIEANIDAFNEVASIVRRFDESMPVVEAL